MDPGDDKIDGSFLIKDHLENTMSQDESVPMPAMKIIKGKI